MLGQKTEQKVSFICLFLFYVYVCECLTNSVNANCCLNLRLRVFMYSTLDDCVFALI